MLTFVNFEMVGNFIVYRDAYMFIVFLCVSFFNIFVLFLVICNYFGELFF